MKQNPIQVEQISDAELFNLFPESPDIVRELIKELEQRNGSLLDKIIEQNARINNESSDDTYRYFYKSWYIQPLREERKLIDQKLARLYRQLRLIEGRPLPNGAITNDLIRTAKQVPLESLFSQKFKQSGNKLQGLCPFVEENTPSFFIYKNTNRCWCFGCQQGYGVIDTYMKLNNTNFNEAVLALIRSKI